MIKKTFKVANKFVSFIRKNFFTRKNFKNFLLAYFILQFESIRKLLINFFQLRIGKSPILFEIFKKEDLSPQFDILREKGFLVLEKTISDNDIERIKEQIVDLPCNDPYNNHVGMFKLNNAPQCVNIAGYQPSDLIKIPQILEIANNPYILSIAQEYFGCTPTLTGVEMWWSLTGREKPEYAQLFHRDFAGLKFLKLFVYLTDVFPDDGPHIYVQGSAHLKKMRRPTRYSDDQIYKTFSKDVVQMCGRKGMMFLEDTFGFHKGMLPTIHNRLILQAIYGIHPLIYANYSPINLDNKCYDNYINRLFLSASNS